MGFELLDQRRGKSTDPRPPEAASSGQRPGVPARRRRFAIRVIRIPARVLRLAGHGLSARASSLTATCVIFACLVPLRAFGQVGQPVTPSEAVVEYELESGWRFLLYPRPGAPTLSFETYVSVGSADDPIGMSGMANLVKNLLFKGSERIGSNDWEKESEALAKVSATHRAWQQALRDGTAQEISAAKLLFETARTQAATWVNQEEFSRILEAAGGSGTLNAYVNQNSTRFVVSLPSNQAELWCWMESERFLRPVFREFFVERAALVEEWNSRVAGTAPGVLGQAVRAAAYGEHPLGRPSAGLGEEIGALEPEAALAFFEARYRPERMVTTIVGNMDPDSMLALLKRYFSRIPARPNVSPPLPALLPQQAERRVLVESEGGPLLWIAWHVPPLAHPDSPAIEIALRILGYARSSRLERRLTRTSSLATNLEVSPVWEGDRRASLAVIRCVPTLDSGSAEIEQAIYEEIQRLTDEGPTTEELIGVKRVATADHYRSLRINSVCAKGLSAALAKTGLWRHFFERERRLNAVQAREVQAVLGKWFVKKRRTVGVLSAPSTPEPADAPSEPTVADSPETRDPNTGEADDE